MTTDDQTKCPETQLQIHIKNYVCVQIVCVKCVCVCVIGYLTI